MPVRRIYAAGGAENERQKARFLEFLINQVRQQTGKAAPVVCLLAQASGENTDKALQWKVRIEAAGGVFSELLTFRPSQPYGLAGKKASNRWLLSCYNDNC